MFTSNFYKLLFGYMNTPTSGTYNVVFKDKNGSDITDVACSSQSSSQMKNGLNWALLDTGNFIKPSTYKTTLIATIANGSTMYSRNYSSTSTDIAGCVIIGDGDTAPTVNDVALSGNLITDFSATTSLNVNDADGLSLTCQYDITNTGAAAFTVKEIALTRCVITASTLAAGNYILLERTVLSAPVTIQPGETKSIVYRIKFI